MIDPLQLTDDDVGRRVVYHGSEPNEEGVLSSWNKHYVFVKFDGIHGQACQPETVSFSHERKTA